MITKDELKAFVESNPDVVTRKESTSNPGLFVIKYKRNVFYDNLWNDALMECRGLVVDADYNPKVVPFKKVFNYQENGTTIDDDSLVMWVEKINGFMAAVTWVDGKIIVSTTGSLDSEFVSLAVDKLFAPENVKVLKVISEDDYAKTKTWLFEVCHEEDPHVIKEQDGAYLIGARDIKTGKLMTEYGLDDYSHKMKVMRPNWGYSSFAHLLEVVKEVDHEGFMVYGLTESLKIKSPYYLVTKFLARMKEKKFETLVKDPNNFKKTIDEEYFSLVNHIVANAETFTAMDEQGKIEFIRKFLS